MGGIGKTALRKELRRLLKEEHAKVIFAVLDFALPSNRDAENALFMMRRDLHQDYKIQFPSFDLAYAWYWQKVHPQASLKKELPFLLEEGSSIAEIFTLFGDIPIVQLAPKIIELTIKGHGKFKEWWTKRGIPELHQLQTMEPNDIVNRLPMFFGHDLGNYVEDKERTVILFLDTYEALWEDKRTEGAREATETKIFIEQWRREYNHFRPHSALGYRPPVLEAKLALTLT